MKKLIVASFAFFAFGISSSALAESNFDGFYAGLGVGRASGTDKGMEYKNDGAVFENATQRTAPEGNLFAVFAGFNKVVEKNILLGVEADYERRGYSSASVQNVNNVLRDTYPIITKVKNGESLRARLGYIFNQDKTLPYITAGVARLKIARSYGDLDNTFGNGTSLAKETGHNGYVTGLGVEHFLTKEISLRGEYRYTRYAARNVGTAEIYYTGTIEKQRFRDHSLRLGIAYNF